ncbi:MAG: hypothetical protein HYT94_03000 [Parcubacteria group bacterium]|nr:hypothetical protein [Parcubacteria group bacterium]
MDREELRKYHDDFIKTLQSTIEKLEARTNEQDKTKDALIEKITKALAENNSLKEDLKGEIGKLKLHNKTDLVFGILGKMIVIIAISALMYVVWVVQPDNVKLKKDEIVMAKATSTRQ